MFKYINIYLIWNFSSWCFVFVFVWCSAYFFFFFSFCLFICLFRSRLTFVLTLSPSLFWYDGLIIISNKSDAPFFSLDLILHTANNWLVWIRILCVFVRVCGRWVVHAQYYIICIFVCICVELSRTMRPAKYTHLLRSFFRVVCIFYNATLYCFFHLIKYKAKCLAVPMNQRRTNTCKPTWVLNFKQNCSKAKLWVEKEEQR